MGLVIIFIPIVVLPALLILFSGLATMSDKIGWAVLSLVPFALCSFLIYWQSNAIANEFEAWDAVVDMMGNFGFLVAMFLGSWFIYFKFRSQYKP